MRPDRKLAAGGALLLALIGVVAAVFLRKVPLAELKEALGSVRPLWLLPGLGLMALFVLWEAAASRGILSALGCAVPLGRCCTYSMLGFCCASLTPSSSGGQPAQIWAMGRGGVPLSLASLNMLLLAVCYQCSMLLCGLGGYVALGGAVGTGGVGRLLLLGTAVNAALTAGMLCLLFFPGLVRRFFRCCVRLLCALRLWKDGGKKAEKAVEDGLAHYARGTACIRRDPGLLLRTFLLTTLQYLSLSLVPCVVCLALGVKGMMARAACTQMVLSLSTAAFPLPGAVGAAEGGFLNLFTPVFGSLTAPAMVLCRGISFYLFLPLCALGAALTLRLPQKRTA